MSAKIQVGCSHEVATVPFVPVPALLYRKYRKMHELDISSVMQCWYFGNYPGIMNKTAGMLAFEDFNGREKEFLMSLALPDWGEHAADIVEAWTLFAEGYSNYPLSNMFQYYGPMHDGVVWPLFLYPAHKQLAPTWKIEFGTSGDVVGECLENHTIEEAIILCREMAEKWNRGVEILNSLRNDFADNPDRLKDIGLAEALGIQFESGYNILSFYALREQLFNAEHSLQKTILDEMNAIVHGEINRSERLIKLCENDSRLGFHSEAEGYKYFPEKLQWRVKLLKDLLQEDFPRAGNAIADGRLVLSTTSTTPVYICGSGKLEQCENFRWKSEYKKEKLIFEIECEQTGNPDQIFLSISTSDIRHPLIIDMYKSGFIDSTRPGCSRRIQELKNGWSTEIIIPLNALGDNLSDVVLLSIIRLSTSNGETKYSNWGCENYPIKYRLVLGLYNPSAMGKLIIEL